MKWLILACITWAVVVIGSGLFLGRLERSTQQERIRALLRLRPRRHPD